MSLNNRFSDFIKYLESLAKKHKEIKHLNDNVSHFIRLDTDELDNSIKQTVGFPVVCLDRYSANLSGEVGNTSKKRGITLMILDYVPDTKDYNRIHDVWDNCEAIADDFISQIYVDITSGKAPGMFDMDLSSVEYELAGNRSLALYGAIVTFPVTSKFCVKPRAGCFE